MRHSIVFALTIAAAIAAGCSDATTPSADTEAPRLVVTGLPDTLRSEVATVPVGLDVIDDGELASITYSVNGAAEQSVAGAAGTGEFHGALQMTLAFGANEVVFRITDRAANRTESRRRTFLRRP